MKPEILLLEPMLPEVETALETAYKVYRPFPHMDPANSLPAAAPRIRAVITGGGIGAANRLIDALPALEIIAINGIGTGRGRSAART